MMDTGFFKWVWRFNALAIAAAVILILIASSSTVLRMLSFGTSNRAEIEVTQAETRQTQEPTRIETIVPIKHIDAENGYLVHLFSDKISRSQLDGMLSESYYSKGGKRSSLINIGQLKPDGEITWMFSSNNQLVVRTVPVSKRNHRYAEGTPQTELILYEVAELDSNEDGKLSSDDLVTVYAAFPNELTVTKIIDKVPSGVSSVYREDNVHALLIAHDDNRMMIEFDKSSFKVLNQITIRSSE